MVGAKDTAKVANDFRVVYSTILRVHLLNSASGFLIALLSIPKATEVMISVVYLPIISLTFRGEPVGRNRRSLYSDRMTHRKLEVKRHDSVTRRTTVFQFIIIIIIVIVLLLLLHNL